MNERHTKASNNTQQQAGLASINTHSDTQDGMPFCNALMSRQPLIPVQHTHTHTQCFAKTKHNNRCLLIIIITIASSTIASCLFVALHTTSTHCCCCSMVPGHPVAAIIIIIASCTRQVQHRRLSMCPCVSTVSALINTIIIIIMKSMGWLLQQQHGCCITHTHTVLPSASSPSNQQQQQQDRACHAKWLLLTHNHTQQGNKWCMMHTCVLCSMPSPSFFFVCVCEAMPFNNTWLPHSFIVQCAVCACCNHVIANHALSLSHHAHPFLLKRGIMSSKSLSVYV